MQYRGQYSDLLDDESRYIEAKEAKAHTLLPQAEVKVPKIRRMHFCLILSRSMKFNDRACVLQSDVPQSVYQGELLQFNVTVNWCGSLERQAIQREDLCKNRDRFI